MKNERSLHTMLANQVVKWSQDNTSGMCLTYEEILKVVSAGKYHAFVDFAVEQDIDRLCPSDQNFPEHNRVEYLVKIEDFTRLYDEFKYELKEYTI
ncbi:MAG TPA: hypothetical protein P5509_10870 [Bacteroidales bacterium]|nr:hypothetical protein [Bacteroidales bacterium]